MRFALTPPRIGGCSYFIPKLPTLTHYNLYLLIRQLGRHQLFSYLLSLLLNGSDLELIHI